MRGRRKVLLISDPEKSGAGFASSGDEIHCSRGIEGEVGHIQRSSREKFGTTCIVARTSWRQVHGNNASIGPVEDEEGVPPGCREMASVSEFYRRGRTPSDVKGCRHRVRSINRKAPGVAGALPPSVVGAANEVIDPARSIEGEADITFVVGVVGEGFAVVIKIEPVGIAEAPGVDFPLLVFPAYADPVTQGVGGCGFGCGVESGRPG